MQLWDPGECSGRSAVWLEASRSEALAAGVEGTWRVAMEKPESTGEVVDGIVRWEYR